MQFMVISNPVASRPSEVRGSQTRFWDWLATQQESGIARACYVKTGRGAILVFDVDSHEHLHRLMTEWADCVPAEFTVYPLIDPAHQEAIARKASPAKA